MVWGRNKGIWHLIVENCYKCTGKPSKAKEFDIVDEPEANACPACKGLKIKYLKDAPTKGRGRAKVISR